FLNRRESPENLWIKCPETGQLVFYKDVESNQFVIPSSNYHMRMSAVARLKDARAKTGLADAVKLGLGKLEGVPVVIGVQDFDFMGGSLGMAAGEAVI